MVILSLFLSGCSRHKAYSSDISFSADENINLNIFGQSSPLKIDIYQLKNNTAFNEATEIGAIAGDTVEKDIISIESFMIQPATKKIYTLLINGQTKYLGIVGEFRAPAVNGWKVLLDVPPKKETLIIVNGNKFSMNK